MGLEDRDWYREEIAARNGRRYNKRNATYSAAEEVVTSSLRNVEVHPHNRFRAVEELRERNRKRWRLLLHICFAVVFLAVTVLLFMRAVKL